MEIGLSNSISKSSTETSEKLGCFSLYRIFKQTLVGSQKSISISSDRNIGVPPEVVHSFRSEYYRPKFAVPFLTIWFIVLLFFTCVENSEKKKNKNGKSYSSWLARFDRKMSFHFLRVFLALVSDRSTSHNGKHQSSASANQIAAFALDHYM